MSTAMSTDPVIAAAIARKRLPIGRPELSHDDYKLIADAYIGDPEDDFLEVKREGVRAQFGVDTIACALLRRHNAHRSLAEFHLEESDKAIQALNDTFLTR